MSIKDLDILLLAMFILKLKHGSYVLHFKVGTHFYSLQANILPYDFRTTPGDNAICTSNTISVFGYTDDLRGLDIC